MAKSPATRKRAEARLLARLGSNVQEARQQAGLSQIGLAKAAGVSQTSVSAIERGETAPSVLLVYQLASALNVEPFELLEGLSLPAKKRG